MKKRSKGERPTTEQLRQELNRISYRKTYRKVLFSTIHVLIVVAAIAVLAATLLYPVLRIQGHSMEPTLDDGEVVVSARSNHIEQGEILSFYYNNKILVKRAIAFPGDWVDIDIYGNVYVNQNKLEEPYVQEKAYGDCNIEFPYQVPDGRIFVLGDHRSTSVDSRNTAVGCVAEEQIVGKILFRVWPMELAGTVK